MLALSVLAVIATVGPALIYDVMHAMDNVTPGTMEITKRRLRTAERFSLSALNRHRLCHRGGATRTCMILAKLPNTWQMRIILQQ